MIRRWRPWIALLVALAALVLLCDDALARVGGGQNYGGGGGGGGSFGGGGGDDGLGLILYLIIRLCIEYPAVGFPLLGVFLTFLAVRWWMNRSSWSRQVMTTSRSTTTGRAAPRRPTEAIPGLAKLREQDPILSVPVLQEYLELVHRRALEAVGTGDWGALTPFVDDTARRDLVRAHPGVTEITEVVDAGLRIERIGHQGDHKLMLVLFLGGRLEKTGDGQKRWYTEERWTFRRASSAVSLPPEDTLRMGCPSCGAAIDTDRMGRCTVCETPITKGQLQWQATGVQVLTRRPMRPPEVGLFAGGDEPSVHLPSRVAPDLESQWRQFVSRHPDFEWPELAAHIREVFEGLQQAWSDGTWGKARPWCTDPMFQNLRFYMEQYESAGWHNRLADVKIEKIQPIAVSLDAWYESITVRIWASMRDWVEDADGKVIGGNKNVARRFSEYWTFLRAAGTGTATKDAHHCPSCGAPLDNVSAAGICGYCETKITTGRFDWVLSRIDQADAYQG